MASVQLDDHQIERPLTDVRPEEVKPGLIQVCGYVTPSQWLVSAHSSRTWNWSYAGSTLQPKNFPNHKQQVRPPCRCFQLIRITQGRFSSPVLELRTLIRDCDTELREYDAILTERIEVIQECLSGKSDKRSKLDARRRSRHSGRRRICLYPRLDFGTLLGLLYAFALFWPTSGKSLMGAFCSASVRLSLFVAFLYMILDG